MSKVLKTYKITNKKTGESFSIQSATPPSKEQVKSIEKQRLETQIQGERDKRNYDNRGLAAKLGEVIYAPSEYIAPKEMAQEDVEKLLPPNRVVRLGQEFASGLLDPSNIPGMIAPALGPVGLAGAGIAYAPQMIKGLYESGKAFVEDPSLETGARAGAAAAFTGLTGAGIKSGMKSYGKPKVYQGEFVNEPPVQSPKSDRVKAEIIDSKLLENKPVQAEFVEPKQLGESTVIEAPPSSAVKQIGPADLGPIKAPASSLPETQLLDQVKTRQLEAGDPYQMGASDQLSQNQLSGGQKQIGEYKVKSPYEMPESTAPLEGEFVEPKQLGPGPTVKSPVEILSSEHPLSLAEIKTITRRRTSSLLKHRETATGQVRKVIDDTLKWRGALPNESEIFELPESESVFHGTSEEGAIGIINTGIEPRWSGLQGMVNKNNPARVFGSLDPQIASNYSALGNGVVIEGSGKGFTKAGTTKIVTNPNKIPDFAKRIFISTEVLNTPEGARIKEAAKAKNIPIVEADIKTIKDIVNKIKQDESLKSTVTPDKIEEFVGIIDNNDLVKLAANNDQAAINLLDMIDEKTLDKNDSTRITALYKASQQGESQTSKLQVQSPLESSKPVIKRAADYKDSGEYDVTIGDKTYQIYRDPESGNWYRANTGKHFSENFLGFDKAGAVENLVKKVGKTEVQPPSTSMEKVQSPSQEVDIRKIPLENEWLWGQDPSLLKSMREGATGKIREEIDTVLGFVDESKSLESWTKRGRTGPVQEPSVRSIGSGKSESLSRDLLDEGELSIDEPQINEEAFKSYQENISNLTDNPSPSRLEFDEIVRLAKESGIADDDIVSEIESNANPSTTNIVNKAWNAITRWNEEKGEAGSVSMESIFKKVREEAKKTGDEGLILYAQRNIAHLQNVLPRLKPESNIGRMGETGLKIERAMEDGQFYSDKLRGQLDILVHDSFKGLTPREIGQRIAVLDDGKEVVINQKTFDDYVDWDKGIYTPKKGVTHIRVMPGSLYDVINNGAEPATPQIADAAELFNQAMDILGTEGVDSGVSTRLSDSKYIPFQKMETNYWPRAYTEGFYESLKKNPKNWDAIIAEVAKSNDISIAEATKILQDPRKYSELVTSAQHRRTLKQDSTIIDPEIVLDHIKNFSGRVGMARALGPKDINGGWLRDAIIQLSNEGFSSKKVKYVNDTISRLVNRTDKPIPGALESGIYNTVTNLNNARLMTSFILNNLANITPTAARVGEGNTLKGFMAMMGNMEASRRINTLAGATVHTGTIEGSKGSLVSKMLGVPMSERFLRTWAGEAGSITAHGEVEFLKTLKPGSAAFERHKTLLDSLLGKDSTEVIERGHLLPDEELRARWQLAKDTQGIVNPATMPSLGEVHPTAAVRLTMNLAMQYKRMAMLGMSSMMESLRINPARTLRVMAITAPIIGEVIGDVGSAAFGAVAGTLTGEGAIKAAIRDVEDRGKSLAKMMKPLLNDKLGLTQSQADLVGRYIENLNRGFALGLIGDFIYSIAFWGGKGGADIIAGGISPAFEFVVDITKAIGNDIEDVLAGSSRIQRGNKNTTGNKELGKDLMNTLKVVAPQRPVSAYNRSANRMKGNRGGGLVVRPPSIPGIPQTPR